KHSFPNYILLNILYKKHKIWQSYFVIYELKMLTIGIEHLGYLLYIYLKLQSTKTPYHVFAYSFLYTLYLKLQSTKTIVLPNFKRHLYTLYLKLQSTKTCRPPYSIHV